MSPESNASKLAKLLNHKILAILVLVFALNGCGGGGGGSSASATLSGVAAVGTPIVNGNIKIICSAGGAIAPTTTSSTGSWSVTLPGQTLPCAVQVSGGTINNMPNVASYHSIAIASGTVNVTPLTDLLVANLIGTLTTPSGWFAGLSPAQLSVITQTKVDAALRNLSIALSGLTALSINNPITTPFSPISGDVNDDMLTALATAMANANVTYNSLLSDASTQNFAALVSELNAYLMTAFSGMPTVITTSPKNGSSSVAPPITATFSETMKASTFTSATFTLTNGSTPVSGTITYNGTTATFSPLTPLASYTSYTATITTGVQDLAGNSMASNYSWSFTTAYQTQYPYVDVLHTSFTYDATRGLLYAFVPSADATHPNTFAIVDVNLKTVTYSPTVDFVPTSLAVSSDGSYLYVGTANTNEVVRLSLPDFSVNLRVNIGSTVGAPAWITPLITPPGQPFDAGTIAVSPQDSGLFAVSLMTNASTGCAIGLRVYKDSSMMAELYGDNYTSVGQTLTFDATGTQLTTLCTAQSPDVVSHLTYVNGVLSYVDSQRGASGSAATLSVNASEILTGGGTKFIMPGFTLLGALQPLTYYGQGDPAPLLHACVFADDAGNYADCLSQTDTAGFAYPTFRAFVLYELTNATPFLAIPLDLPMSRGTSRIFRTGPGQFAVSVGYTDQNPIWLDAYHFHYLPHNTRIYFIGGLNVTYP